MKKWSFLFLVALFSCARVTSDISAIVENVLDEDQGVEIQVKPLKK